jgi:fumarate reductase iron-sulfur subunit
MLSGRGTEAAMDLRVAMQQIMTAKVGIFRRGADLEQAVDELQTLLVRSRNIGVRSRAAGANPELVAAYRTQKMLKLAVTIAYGALVRTESRDAHFREDYPRRNDADWLKRTLASWTNEQDTLPTLSYETLDVKTMELPPGWRGYGTKDYTDHPDTAARQKKSRLSGRSWRRPDASPCRRRSCRTRSCCRRASAAPTNASTRGFDHGRRSHAPHAHSPDPPLQPAGARPARPACSPTSLEEADGMTLFIALNEIREKQDPSLQFDFVCRAGICGSCGMMINGRPGLACRTLTKQLTPETTLAPLPVFELIGDLSVNTGKWMRHMSERLATWVHLKTAEVDLGASRGDGAGAGGADLPARPVHRVWLLCRRLRHRAHARGLVGAVGLNRIARFRLDPRDTREDAAYYELIGDDSGVFGCMSLLACHDLCPKVYRSRPRSPS